MTDDETDPEDREQVKFDESTEFSLVEEAEVWEYDLETLEAIGALETTTETRDGETVVTECSINPMYLALMATEFNTTEQTLGSRFGRTKWRAESRLRL